jgi:putative membrane protein
VDSPIRHDRNFTAYVVLTMKGFCMGAADVVPGVSGGTMAFILGIYEDLIESIKSFDMTFLKLLFSLRVRDAMSHASWQFLVALGLGIFMAILTLARILTWLLQNQPVLIWSFFFGLIVASLFTVSKHLTKWTPSIFVWIAFGALFTYVLVGMVPAKTPDTACYLFMSGAVAICATILPGISGAFILVLLGKYHYVLEAVNNRDILTLLLVAAGAGVGLVTFVRLLTWLFNRYHDVTIALLTGLMLGSLRKIWPWKETLASTRDTHGNVIPTAQVNVLPSLWDKELVLAICLVVVGFLVVVSLNFLAERGNERVVPDKNE